MKKSFQELALKNRRDVFNLATDQEYMSVGSENPIEEIKDFMLTCIRKNQLSLSREELNDIFTAFNNKIIAFRKNLHRNLFGDIWVDYDKIYQYYDSFIGELMNSFDQKNEKIPDWKPIMTWWGYINDWRIESLKTIFWQSFDSSKLIRLCEELNIAYNNQCYYTVGFLLRIIKDHIPPIFWKKSFAEVAANIWNNSVKKSLQHLESSLKNIADEMAHGHISKKEILPNEQRISFQADLDVLLWLIIKELS